MDIILGEDTKRFVASYVQQQSKFYLQIFWALQMIASYTFGVTTHLIIGVSLVSLCNSITRGVTWAPSCYYVLVQSNDCWVSNAPDMHP